MEETKVSENEILEAIYKANSFFHLNYEKDKRERNRFYKIKDSIVVEILRGRYPGITCTANGVHKDTDNSYMDFTLASGDTTISVHFPIERMPAKANYNDCIERDAHGMPVSVRYYKDMSKYAEANVDEAEYTRCFDILDGIYTQIYSDRVDALNNRELRDIVCSTSCEIGMKPIIYSNGKFMFDGSLVFCRRKKKKNKRVPLFACKVTDIREAMKAVRSFNFNLLYHYLKSHGKLEKIKTVPTV